MADPASSDQSSPQRILAAAREEFDLRGLVGARIESIAKRAGLNKALVYRHFTSKENLYREVLRDLFARRSEAFLKVPLGFGEALVHWTRAAKKRPLFLRMLMRESLNEDIPIVHEGERRQYHLDQLADLEKRRDEGQIHADLDPTMLMVAMFAVVAFPAAYPRLTALMTGLDPAGRTFRERWRRFLLQLAERLAASPP